MLTSANLTDQQHQHQQVLVVQPHPMEPNFVYNSFMQPQHPAPVMNSDFVNIAPMNLVVDNGENKDHTGDSVIDCNNIEPVVAALLDLSDNGELYKETEMNSDSIVVRQDMSYTEMSLDNLRRQLEASEERMFPLVQNIMTLPRCDVCDERIQLSKMKTHMKSCEHRKQFYCEQCGDGFNQHLNYVLHVAIHDTSSEALQCPACEKEFSRLASFRCHLTLHRLDDVVACEICQEEFTYYTQLKRHVRLVHQESSSEQFEEEASVTFCKECGIMMTTKEQIREHRLTHRKIRESLRVRSRKRRKRDSSAVSVRFRGRPEFFCSTCGKNFSKRNALERHELIHSGQRPFVCKLCNKTFNQKGALMLHEAVHADQKPYKCQLCDAGFTQRGNLRKHVQRLHPPNVMGRSALRCPLCSCVFRSVQPLNVHLGRRHNQSLANQDSAAGLDIVSVGARAVNANSDNTALASSNPDQPGRQPNAKPDLLKDALSRSGLSDEAVVQQMSKTTEHENTESSVRTEPNTSVQCSITELQPLTEQTSETSAGGGRQLAAISQKLLKKATAEFLKDHVHRIRLTGDSFYGSQLRGVRVRTMNGRKYWKCSICVSEFTRGSDLVRHMRRHTGEKPYPCSMCGRAFSLRTTLQRHLQRHLGICDARCYICLKQLSSTSSLRKHMRTHTRQPLRCQHCPSQFKSKNMLNKHTKKAHSAEDNPSASSRAAANLDHLEQPLLETADGLLTPIRKPGAPKAVDAATVAARPHVCSVCNAAFRRLLHLRDHEQSHTGVRQYHCRQCGQAFRQCRTLRDHLKKHSGRRPYRCHHCPKAFVSSGALRRHAVVHSDHQPFVCPYCCRRFKRGALCRQHIRVRHANERPPSPAAMLLDQSFYFQMDEQQNFYQQMEPNTMENNIYASVGEQNTYAEPVMDGWFSEQQQQPCQMPLPFQATSTDAILTDVCPQPLLSNCDLSSVIADVLNSDSLMGAPLPDPMPESSVNLHPVEQVPLRPPPPLYLAPTKAEQYEGVNRSLPPTVSVVHMGEPRRSQFDCAVCGCGCNSMEELLVHLKEPNEHTAEAHREHTYSCPLCAIQYNGVNRIIRHFMAQHTHRSQTSEYSQDNRTAVVQQGAESSVSDKTTDLALHLAQHGLEANDRKCHYCGKEFKKPSDLVRHLRIHTGEKPFQCSVCGSRFRVKSTLNTHMKTHANEPVDVVMCNVCSKKFMSRGALKVHTRQHTNECPFKCEQCSSAFRTSSQKQNHVRRVHESKTSGKNKRIKQEAIQINRPLPANEPPQIGTHNSAFSPVLRADAVQPAVAERLSLTVQPDPANGSLRVDVQPLCAGAVPNATGSQPAQFIIDTPLLKDLQMKEMVLKIPLPESHFGPGTELSVDPHQLLQSLDRHNQTDTMVVPEMEPVANIAVANAEERYFIVECLICDLHFESPEQSRVHFASPDHEIARLSQRHAVDERLFACECCPKSFPTKTKLSRHVRVHTREKPFTCLQCPRSYSQKSSLEKHVKSAHDKRRPHVCQYCAKSFVHKDSLTKHEKVHTKRQMMVQSAEHNEQSLWTQANDERAVSFTSL